MKLPELHGTCHHQDLFVYSACDSQYFDEFGHAFINSIQHNTKLSIHLHLFNPRNDQIDFCQEKKVSVSWEHVTEDLFRPAAQRWAQVPITEPEKSRYDRTLNAMGKGNDRSVIERLQKTYYACARFIRLSDLYRRTQVLAIDVDAVVRKSVPALNESHDFYIHHITGKRARYLAGGLWLNATPACQQFLSDYAQELKSWFERDYVYWGLDQDVLDPIVPRYQHGQLPMSYIDWNMHPDSYIWTAKGTRKELAVFVNETARYKS